MESVLGIFSCKRKRLFTDNRGTITFVMSTLNHTLGAIAANNTEGSSSSASWCPAVLHVPLMVAFSHKGLEKQLQSGSKNSVRKAADGHEKA